MALTPEQMAAQANAPEAVAARQAALNRASLRNGAAGNAPPVMPAATPPGSTSLGGGAAAPEAPAAPAAPATAKSGGWFKRAGNVFDAAKSGVATGAKSLAVNVGPAAIGAGAAEIQRASDANAPVKTTAYGGDQPGQIPTGVPAGTLMHDNSTPTPRPLGFATPFSTDTERNIANTVMALPGVSQLGGLAATLRAGSAAAKLASTAGTVGNVAAGVAAGGMADNALRGPQNGAAPDVPAAATGAPAGEPRDPQSWARPGPAAASPPASKDEILRQGNNLSGTNVTGGFKYTGDGRPAGMSELEGGGGLKGGGTVTSMNTIGVDGYMKQLANLRALPEPERGGMGGIGNTDTLRQSPIDPNWMAKHQMANSGSPLDRRQAMLLASQEGIANKSNSQALALAQLREGGENSRAQLSSTTARRGQDIQQGLGSEGHAITREGNQLTYAGHMAPLQLAAMQRGLHSQVYQGVGAGKEGPTADHHLAAAAQFDAMGLSEQADKARAAATQMQGLRGTQEAQSKAGAAGAAEVFKPMFTRKVTDAQGNVKEEFDEVGAAKAAATMRSLHGAGFDKLTDEQKRSAYTDVATQQKNMEAERQVLPGFIDRAKDLVGMYQPPPAATGARDLRGGVMTNAGLLSPPGVDRRSTLVKLPSGETINYGIADDAQIAAIKKRTLR